VPYTPSKKRIIRIKISTLETTFCPNLSNCQIILIDTFASDPPGRDYYKNNYCQAGEESWIQCKRFQTKRTLNLCPDFIMPDSILSQDEILDWLEQE
jgi:hypothetical protein